MRKLLLALVLISGCCYSPEKNLEIYYRGEDMYTRWVWACPGCGENYERRVDATICARKHED